VAQLDQFRSSVYAWCWRVDQALCCIPAFLETKTSNMVGRSESLGGKGERGRSNGVRNSFLSQWYRVASRGIWVGMRLGEAM